MQITREQLAESIGAIETAMRDLRAERDLLAEQRAAMDSRGRAIETEIARLTGHWQSVRAMLSVLDAQEPPKDAPSTQEPCAEV